jgi:osmotically-inducible protein OsmY
MARICSNGGRAYLLTIVKAHHLEADISRRLLSNAALQASKIEVKVENGAAILRGPVHTYLQRRAAESIVKEIRGITSVVNELEVRLTIGDFRPDATLQRVVRDIFDCLALLPRDQIDATVRNGWVTLKGTVDCAFQQRLAEDAVAPIAGVRGIHNQIAVVPRGSALTNLQATLRRRIGRRTIGVEVDGSRVRLTGNVRTCAERDGLADLAWCAPGVSAVENLVKIKA